MKPCRPFTSLLIANRGEIACRIIDTARRMGLRAIAVYSEVDKDSRHVRLADQALSIGPAPARESYLSIPAIIAAAKASGAEALHPGYGFLSESADLAAACRDADLVFIGPPPEVMAQLGDKAAAKKLAVAKKVPLLPGFHGLQQDAASLVQEAEKIGFPLLIKAKAGGGGKGMRLVSSEGDFTEALEGAKREAWSAFGSAEVLLEAYLPAPRHIEVQILADSFGRVVHIFDRDCSLQRRHQKVVEEAPAPFLDEPLRTAIADAAVRLLEGSGYIGAATVEFLVQGKDFYFLEVNTRLQVEHPVSEMITGLDLVEWQIRIAQGEALPQDLRAAEPKGHAVEARLYAEDPINDFLPSSGPMLHFSCPLGEAGAESELRLDAGVDTGDEVSSYYDPMIAKIIAWGEDRAGALARLEEGLKGCQLLGPANNLDFLRHLTSRIEKMPAPADTACLEKLAPEIIAELRVCSDAEPNPRQLALLGLGDLLSERQDVAVDAFVSPWNRRDAWRAGGGGRIYRDYAKGHGPEEGLLTLAILPQDVGYRIELPDGCSFFADGSLSDEGCLRANLDGQDYEAIFLSFGDLRALFASGDLLRFHAPDWLALAPASGPAGGRVLAPLSGRIVAVKVEKGDRTSAGMPLVILEAMKMEHCITASRDGRVSELAVSTGDQVEEGCELLLLEEEGDHCADAVPGGTTRGESAPSDL